MKQYLYSFSKWSRIYENLEDESSDNSGPSESLSMTFEESAEAFKSQLDSDIAGPDEFLDWIEVIFKIIDRSTAKAVIVDKLTAVMRDPKVAPKLIPIFKKIGSYPKHSPQARRAADLNARLITFTKDVKAKSAAAEERLRRLGLI